MDDSRNVVGSLKPNSHAYRNGLVSQEKKEVGPRVKSKIQDVKVKKTPWKRFTRALFVDDAQTIKEYAVNDVIIPTFRDLIFSTFSGMLEMALYGVVRGSNRKGGAMTRAHTPYNSFFASSPQPAPKKDTAVHASQKSDWNDWVFTFQQAEEVIATLTEVQGDYGYVRVADLYDAVDKTAEADFTDQKWGWFDISGIQKRSVGGGGYVLILPKPVPLT